MDASLAERIIPKDGRKLVLMVTALAAVFYLAFATLALWLHDGNPLWFVWIGERYADLNPDGRLGYDGQFVYYLARDGWEAETHLDNPPYRLQRILLPALARLLSLNQPALIPWILIGINLASIIWTTYLLADWLRRNDLSPAYSLIVGLYIGTFMAFSRDLTEPLAICLSTWGALRWLQGDHWRGVLLLALAALAKETMLIFPVGIIAAGIWRRHWRTAAMAFAAMGPFLSWEILLFIRFDRLPISSGASLEFIPLAGILPHLRLDPGTLSAFLFVALPSLALIPKSFKLLQQQVTEPTTWWLLLNIVFVLLMPYPVYEHVMHAARNASGLVLAAALTMPQWNASWRVLATGYWVSATFVWLIPVLRWAPWLSQI